MTEAEVSTQRANHLFDEKIKQWKTNRRQLISDKNGVTITDEAIKVDGETTKYEFKKRHGVYKAKLNIRQFNQKNCNVTYKFIIKCKQGGTAVKLESAELLQPTSGNNMFKLLDPKGLLKANQSVVINTNTSYFIFVEFLLPEAVMGIFEAPIVFNFLLGKKMKLFTIAREIVIEISEDIAVASDADIRNPYTSVKWPTQTRIKYSTRGRLRYEYTIPHEYWKILEANCQRVDVSQFIVKQDNLSLLHETIQIFRNGLTDYVQYFHLLLWFDEIAQILALNKYNMSKISINVFPALKYIELSVPGLNEKRPSLIRGDRIQIRLIEPPTSDEDNVTYEGTITQIRQNLIKVGSFHRQFYESIGACETVTCDVRLVLGRLPYERMHRSVEKIVTGGLLSTLFPDPNTIQPYNSSQQIHNLCFFNKDVSSNLEQKIAVENIVNGTSMGAPFIVFGPPGTGKTVTIVEAILQIKRLRPDAKILVCAPANDACDMLALKLQPHCTKQELIRVNSESRETEVPKVLREYSNYNGADYTKVIVKELLRYRIIVSTLVFIAGFLDKYYPDIVFIDEASHASEPESNCAIALLSPGKPVVLAGDPKQLGPICFSNFAKDKLGIGFLERLMTTNELYKNNDPKYVVMLKRNFRSHPTILKIPNDLFYGSQLTAVSKPALEDPIAKVFIYPLAFSNIRKQGEAIEFCAINGREKKNGTTPSFYNDMEMETVVLYVEALMSLNQTHKIPISERDIGIVTPYKRQVYRVKHCLEDRKWPNIDVGTVETFQGREKRVIIVTTVRAKTSFLLQDKDYKLGFVKDDKRFNVALTRAISKLIVIGCPSVLIKDKKWESYIKFCQEKNAYFGIEYEKRTCETKQSVLKAFQSVQFEG